MPLSRLILTAGFVCFSTAAQATCNLGGGDPAAAWVLTYPNPEFKGESPRMPSCAQEQGGFEIPIIGSPTTRTKGFLPFPQKGESEK